MRRLGPLAQAFAGPSRRVGSATSSRLARRRTRHCPNLRRFRLAFIVGIVLVAVVLATGVLLVTDVTSRLPQAGELATLGVMANATVIYDAFDQPVFTFFRERRQSVPLKDVSPHLINAVIAVEDHRFYRHGGIDLIRVGGAALADVAAGRIVQGGSTITQQLARLSFLSRERTFRRKLAEAITAVQLERAYPKDRILEFYLNKVYLGAGFYGAETAAQGYFGKPATDLTLAEAALLAGLIQAPSRYSPTGHPERALRRRDMVLNAMLETGVVDVAEVERAKQEPLRLHNKVRAPPDFGRYFEAEVRRRLVDRFGSEPVYTGGLHVYTTLVPELQRVAEAATANGLDRIERMPRYPYRDLDHMESGDARTANRLQAALIALDPRTGAVRALVGGRQFADSSFNRATQARRQPGSAFKPFLFAAALNQGLTAVTRLVELDRPVRTARGDWLPDDEHPEVSALTLRAALRLSSNRAAVRLLELTGIDRTVDYAGRFGLGPQPGVPSIALGSGTVTLEALTSAYATFANRGVVPRPTYIRRVEQAGGEVLFALDKDEPAAGSRAISSATAFIVANLLRDVVDAGTGSRVRREGFLAPAGGKTGTSDDYRDVWFVGFTPELAAGVWIGFDRPQTIMAMGYASDLAAPVWANFMHAATADQSGRWLDQPADVVAADVCALSGALATEACRRTHPDDLAVTGSVRPTYVEYFAEGTEPVEHCHIHTGRSFVAFFRELFGRRDPGSEQPESARSEPTPELPHRLNDVSLNQSVAVIHDHIFGDCAGRLVADPDSIRYETTHKDAFTIAHTDVETFEVDSVRHNLRIKPRGGHTYNFTGRAGRANALFVFHAEVERARRHLAAPD